MNIKDFRCNYDKNTLVVPRALVGAACQALGIVVAAGTLLSFDPNLYTIGIVLTGIILMAVGAYILLDEICGKNGPCCTAFVPKGEPVPPARCAKTVDMFEVSR